MADIANEPSMEEILSSIKRIIAEEGEGATGAARGRATPKRAKAAAAPENEEILELTETVADPDAPASGAEPAGPELVSGEAAIASRQSLAALSALVVKPEAPGNTLEGLVREMLRPMLKEWLDANLSGIVESMVAKEIARITGKSL